MKRGPNINHAMAAALLSTGLTLREVAEKVGAKNANTVRVALARNGVTKRNIDALPLTPTKQAIVTERKQSADLREAFGEILSSHVGALGKIAPRANLKHLARVGAAIEPLARTAKIVHGWDSGDKTGLLLEMCDPGAVIEIAPACGPDTPISSVPTPPAIVDAPQVTEEPDSEPNAS